MPFPLNFLLKSGIKSPLGKSAKRSKSLFLRTSPVKIHFLVSGICIEICKMIDEYIMEL
jgi:hypothetical protein